MGFSQETFVHVPEGIDCSHAVTVLTELVQAAKLLPRVQVTPIPEFAWVKIDDLGFFSMDQEAEGGVVGELAALWRSEVVMLAVQTTASCAAYGHYINGKLYRFLSAADALWLESFGTPEDWEAEFLKIQPVAEYPPNSPTRFSDQTTRRLKERYRIPK